MEKFNKDFEFRGRHARTVKTLQNVGLIDTYYEIIPIAAMVGLKFNRRSTVDNSINSDGTVTSASVPGSTMFNHRKELELTYKLVVLNMPSEEKFAEKADRLFRENEYRYRVEFEEYIRGGIDILQEKLLRNKVHTKDNDLTLCSHIFDYINSEVAQAKDREHILNECDKALKAQDTKKHRE